MRFRHGQTGFHQVPPQAIIEFRCQIAQPRHLGFCLHGWFGHRRSLLEGVFLDHRRTRVSGKKMFLSSDAQFVTEKSDERFGGYESHLTVCFLSFLPINFRKEFESWCQKIAMMLQVTKTGIAKPWRLTIILVRGRAIRPAYEGIETAVG